MAASVAATRAVFNLSHRTFRRYSGGRPGLLGNSIAGCGWPCLAVADCNGACMPEQTDPWQSPDAPAPPPRGVAVRGGRILAILGIVALVWLVLLIRFPLTAKKGYMVGGISNFGLLHRGLSEFEMEYGGFPAADTIAEVRRKSGTHLTLGDGSSNELFVQLLATNHLTSEAFAHSSRSPDSVFTCDVTALAPGECDIAYIAGLSSSANPQRPIAFRPVIPGTRTLDAKLFEGKALILHLNGEVSVVDLDPSGNIVLNGMDFLDPRQSVWNGHVPDVKWPR